jgi:DNA-binding transcriptional ArsR family regulator
MDHAAIARLHDALGSEVRLRIVELVSAHKEMCVCELVDQLRLSQANVSRHVSVLRSGGVLTHRKVGTWVLLRVDESALRRAGKDLLNIVRTNHAASRHEDAEARLTDRCAAVRKV